MERKKSNILIKFDFAIKNILRDKSNFVILEGFLSELLKKDVKIINLLESESNKISLEDKSNRVDILAKLDNEELVIIEIQNKDELDYFHRILYGTSKLITENISQGEGYDKVKKVISVNIIYFDLGEGKDYVYHGTTNFVGLHEKDKLNLSREQKVLFNKKEVYQIYPEYYLLMVNKFDKDTKDGLDEWIYFLKTDKVLDNFRAKGIKEAKKKLDVLKLSDKDRKEYEKYLDELRFRASILQTEKFKIEFAELEGIKKGIEEGKKQGTIEIAKNMKKLGVDIETIIKTTNLTKEEIDNL